MIVNFPRCHTERDQFCFQISRHIQGPSIITTIKINQGWRFVFWCEAGLEPSSHSTCPDPELLLARSEDPGSYHLALCCWDVGCAPGVYVTLSCGFSDVFSVALLSVGSDTANTDDEAGCDVTAGPPDSSSLGSSFAEAWGWDVTTGPSVPDAGFLCKVW